MPFKNKIGLRIAKFIVEQTVSILLVQSCVVLIENPETRAENQRGINCTDRARNLVGWYAVSHHHSKKNLFRVDENRTQQCFDANIVQCCQQY